MTTQTPDSVDSQIAVADRLRDWSAGDPLSAGRLTRMTQAVNRNTGMVSAPRMLLRAVRQAAAAVATGVKLQIVGYGRVVAGQATNARATFRDHIICRLRDTTDGTWSEFMVAKPRHLQARNARVTRILDRPSDPTTVIRLQYEGAGLPVVALDRRIARDAATLEEEEQIITPSYAIGETITVGRVGHAITGVTVDLNHEFAEPEGFIDVHDDGSPVDLDLMDMGMYRNWCHPPTETPRPEL